MGLWSSIKKAAKGVVKAAKAVVNAVEEVVSDAVETVGNVIEDALNWVGGHIPYVGAVFKWIGAVISSTFDAIGALVKGAIAIVAGFWGGIITTFVGVFVGVFTDWSVLSHGLGIFLSGIGGGVLLILGQAVNVLQSIFHLQPFERKLTAREEDIVRRVFRDSIALYNIRLVEGWAGVYSLNPRPFTLGNTIYLKDRDITAEPGLLIHECVHVWQYQNNGASYIGSALGAQAFIDNAYDWEQDILRGNSQWIDFNKESQGEFFEDLWYCGSLDVGGVLRNGNGEFFLADDARSFGRFYYNRSDCRNFVFPNPPTGTNYTDMANNAVGEVRNAQSVRLSALWS